MNFSCENCQRRYSIADERLRERAVKVRCKQCGTIRSVGPLAGPPVEEASGRGGDEERTRMVALDDLERLRAQASSDEDPPEADTPTPGDDVAGWFAMLHGRQEGPFEAAALEAKIAAGEVLPRTFLWKRGMADWRRASELPELAPLFPKKTTPPAGTPATAAESPRAKAAPRARLVRPPEPADGAPVTASQILDSDDLQRALRASPPAPKTPATAPTPRRSTAELDAAELFGGLELSKISRMPQPPDLSDILKEGVTALAREEAAEATRTQASPPSSTQRPSSGPARRGGPHRRDARFGGALKAAIAVAVLLGVTAGGLAAASSVGLIRLEVGAVDAATGTPVNVPLLSSEGWSALGARLVGDTPRVDAAQWLSPAPAAAPAAPPAAGAVAQPTEP